MTKNNHLETFLRSQTELGQFQAITADDPLVVVSAGAGTGKTWTLAWRFIWAIATGRAKVDEILTLTFTEKAATEMSERIRSLLLDLSRKIPSYKKTFLEAAQRIDEAYISTIHAFSMRVLKESGLSTTLDPESNIVAPPQEVLFWDEGEKALDLWDKHWFQRQLPKEWHAKVKELLGDPLFMSCVNNFGPSAIVGTAQSCLALFASQGLSPEDIWTWGNELADRDASLLQSLKPVIFQRWRDEWNKFLKPQEGLFYSLTELGKSSKTLSQRIESLERDWNTCPLDENLPTFIESLILCLKGASGKLSDEIAEHLGEPVRSYRDRLKKDEPWLEAYSKGKGIGENEHVYRRYIMQISALFWKGWDVFRHRKNRLSFDDMIRYAIEALGNSPHYASRFKEILVDEFQDTNPLQDQLIQEVCQENQRLFIVGDLKQSIYRFRHADLTLFGSYIRRAQSGEGRYIVLDTSFRSRENLVQGVNSLFALLWEKGLGEELPLPYDPLKVPRHLEFHEERQQCTVDPLLLFIEAGEKQESIDDVRLRQTRRLAHTLFSYHHKKKTIWDKKEQIQRPVQWSDMAILVPSRSIWFPLLEKVFFEEFHIPIYLEGSTSYFSRSEIQDLIALLNFLDNPESEADLMGFLSSPFSGLSLEDVRNLASQHPAGYRVQAFCQEYPELALMIKDWRLTAHLLGPSAVLASFLERGATLLVFPAWKRRRVAANLRKAVDIAREFESSIGTSLPGCAAYLREAVRRQEKVEEADSAGEKEDVIRVLTVHGSKGLEFPVLALMGMERTSNSGEKSSLTPSKKLGIALSRIPGNENDKSPLTWSLAKLLEARDEYEEWQRLFYVACTRARDSLILCGALPFKKEGLTPKEGSWLEMLCKKEGDIAAFIQKEDLPTLSSPFNEGKEKEQENAPIAVPCPEQNCLFLSRVSATSFALYRYCPYAFRLKHRQGQELVWEQPSDERDEGGTDLGSLAHYLLSQWNFVEEPIEVFFPNENNWQIFGEKLPPDLRPIWFHRGIPHQLYTWLSTFQKSPTVERIQKHADAVLKEVPFQLHIPQGPQMGGAIDLLWKEGDCLFIRDYKITTISKVPKNLYNDQILFYGLAAQKIFAPSRISLALWHLREGQEEKVDTPDPQGWEGLEEAIKTMAKGGIAGPFSPLPGRCTPCPFKHECSWPSRYSCYSL
ncbi:UvrD-helicase domain-containing protein [Aminobacterium mobile]|uniref:UvrD-helicase domain-containing protein n=1 Tax=Aminobacterium mobile TaxID=81467 RepID=UPI000467CCD4|nr:UvrD-helicase domain-containing protein [Aminobacterium mobile]